MARHLPRNLDTFSLHLELVPLLATRSQLKIAAARSAHIGAQAAQISPQ